MIERGGIWSAIAMLALATACTPSEDVAETERLRARGEAATSAAAGSLPPVSVLVVHRVSDYDAWKKVFDDHAPARKEASCLGHYLKRGVDDPNLVYVYCLATDADRLRSFLDGDDLAETMNRAGVVGSPTILRMQPMSRNLVSGQLLPGIIVVHTVEDYAAWRVVYDELDGFRRQSGIVGHAVSRELAEPNRVVVYHQARDVAELRSFVDSAELEDAMRRAGVVGDPDIHFIRVVDFADY